MYARTTTVSGRTDALDRAIAEATVEVLPRVRAMEGNIGMSLVVDRSAGECIATTAWRDQEALRATAETVKPMRARVAATMEGTAEVHDWEVAVMHRLHQAPEGSCVRSTWTRSNPAGIDQTLDFYRMTLLPQMEQLEGFCSASLLIDRGTGSAVSSVAFGSRAALEATRPSGTSLRDTASRSTGVEILAVREYDLVLAHLDVPELV